MDSEKEWPVRKQIRLPGLRIFDIELNGSHSSAWKVAKLGHAAFLTASLEKYHLLRDRYQALIVNQTLKISRKFYTLENQSSHLDFNCEITYLGRTSLQHSSTVTENGEIVAEFRTGRVFVDKFTNLPAPPPSTWRSQFGSYEFPGKPERVLRFEMPKDVRLFVSYAKCLWNDIDLFNHMNNANYSRHCLEAASAAAKSGYLTKLSGNLFSWLVTEMRQLYIGQWPQGEEARIETWENPTHPFTLHFNISVHEKLIYQNTIVFFDDQNSKL